MPSPFPGMDLYLETPELWPDFHGNLASEIQRRLNAQFQPRYFARLGVYLTYEEVAVGRTPLEVPTRLSRVEIWETATRQLVTVIEILSPVNKRRGHPAHARYLRKRRDLLRTAVHLVEIDLLRAGDRPPIELPIPPAQYYITISRAEQRPDVDLWPITLPDHLPTLSIPLLEPDPDARVDLAASIAAVYEDGAYGAQIDYRQPPPPPLTPEEAEWINQLLAPLR